MADLESQGAERMSEAVGPHGLDPLVEPAEQGLTLAERLGAELGSQGADASGRLSVETAELVGEVSHTVAAAAPQIPSLPIAFEWGWLAHAAASQVETMAFSLELMTVRTFGAAGAAAAMCQDYLAEPAKPLLAMEFGKVPGAVVAAIGHCATALAMSVEQLVKVSP